MSNIPKSFAEERDEAAKRILGQAVFTTIDKPAETIHMQRMANWCLESTLVSQMAEALKAMIGAAKEKNCGLRVADEALEAYAKARGTK